MWFLMFRWFWFWFDSQCICFDVFWFYLIFILCWGQLHFDFLWLSFIWGDVQLVLILLWFWFSLLWFHSIWFYLIFNWFWFPCDFEHFCAVFILDLFLGSDCILLILYGCVFEFHGVKWFCNIFQKTRAGGRAWREGTPTHGHTGPHMRWRFRGLMASSLRAALADNALASRLATVSSWYKNRKNWTYTKEFEYLSQHGHERCAHFWPNIISISRKLTQLLYSGIKLKQPPQIWQWFLCFPPWI